MNPLVVLYCTASLAAGSLVGGLVMHLTITSQTTCLTPSVAAVTPSPLFNSQPVPLTGYKSY